MLYKGDLITLSNKKEYIVIDQIKMDDKDYVYLITKDGVSGIVICSIENDTLTKISDAELLQKLIITFKEKQCE